MEEKSENTLEKYIRDATFFMIWLAGREATKILALNYKKKLFHFFLLFKNTSREHHWYI